ncbi:MAG TPA: hypothetical protein VF271_04950 [Rhodanobacteraceae bacterium]
MSRRLECLALFLAAVLMAPACMAAQYTFTNGNFVINVPDSWSRIVYAPGDPESMVFQVPDPSPTQTDTLARVTITSEKVRDLISFRQFVGENSRHAQALPGFHATGSDSTPTVLHYTAQEGTAMQTYNEHYYFRDGYAVMVRCVRPAHSQAGAAWTAAFDKDCAGVSTHLN